jgi:hypothetical protein
MSNYNNEELKLQKDCGCGCKGAGTCGVPKEPFDYFKEHVDDVFLEFKSHLQSIGIHPTTQTVSSKRQLTKKELQSPHNKKIRNNFFNSQEYNNEEDEENEEKEVKTSPKHDFHRRASKHQDFSNKISQ